MEEKKVSVIMSTYNETKKELDESINSILQQDYHCFEFIIVNDNPENVFLSDYLQDIQRRNKCIHVVKNEENCGLPSSLNRAIACCSGEYVMRMDADDISTRDRMRREVEYLNEHPDCAMVSANCMEINEVSKENGRKTIFSFEDDKIKRVLPWGSIIVHPAVMIRKSILVSLEGYRDIAGAEDYDLWLRMVSCGCRMHIISEPILLYYRIRESSITRTNYANSVYRSIYVSKLFKERMRKGYDTFSQREMETFLEKKCRISKRKDIINIFYCSLRNGTKFKRIFSVIKLVLANPFLIRICYRIVIYKCLVKLFNKGE